MPRLATLRYLVAALCLGALLPATLSDTGIGQVRTTGKLEAAYRATLLGIPIGDIGWTIDLRDSRFSAAATGSTVGLFQIFAHGHGNAEAHGSIAGKEPVASAFKVSFTSGNSTDEIKIAFNGGKAKETLAHPRPPIPGLVPLTDAYRTGVVDPMTALLVHVPGNGNTSVPAACERKIAVFDGHMRYDLRLAFKRMQQVKAATGYRGPAVVCAVYFTPLAGYDPNRAAIKYLQAERGMEIWLAPLIGTRLMVPFRFSVPTPIGVGVLQATRFTFEPQPEHSSAISTN
ncbi:MAG TPA: DUF3108 domain-containing protein [Xanthobacteraceae bacterium]|nr:DUF3108 domain-containing protein [Xanthobacteraceae bacterium]